MQIGQQLSRDVVGRVPRVQRDQAHVALGQQPWYPVRIDFVQKYNAIQATRGNDPTQPANLTAPPYKQEADVSARSQRGCQVDQTVHALRGAHVSGVDENRPPRERTVSQIDASRQQRRRREPVVEDLDPCAAPAIHLDKPNVGRRLYANDVRRRVLIALHPLEKPIDSAFAHESGIHRPVREQIPQDQVPAAAAAALQPSHHRAEKDRRRIPDHAIPADLGEWAT